MLDTQFAIVPRDRKSEIPAQFRSWVSKIVMWLALIQIGFLAFWATVFISLMMALGTLADTAIRRIDRGEKRELSQK